MAGELLRTEGLTKTFGGLRAVDGVDLSIAEGQVQSIIGPNGAGKSTFFNLLAGSLMPSSGRIWFRGRDIAALPHYAVSRLGIVKTYQITTIFKNLSVYENVRIAVQARHTTYNFWTRAGKLRGVAAKAEAIQEAIQLAHRHDARAAELSHGEQRHLEIGIALAGDPVLLLLDEPTAGMSPEETVQSTALIKNIARQRTVVIVEHDLRFLFNLAERIIVLVDGQKYLEGTPEEVRKDERLQKIYFGE